MVSGVSYRVEGGVAILTLENPPVNALSLPVRAGLAAALLRAQQTHAVRALVLTGAGGTFSAGADIGEVASGAAASASGAAASAAVASGAGASTGASATGASTAASTAGARPVPIRHWRLPRATAALACRKSSAG